MRNLNLGGKWEGPGGTWNKDGQCNNIPQNTGIIRGVRVGGGNHSGEERRKSTRVSITDKTQFGPDCIASFENDQRALKGTKIVDISTGGFRLLCDGILKLGDELSIRHFINKRRVITKGIVVGIIKDKNHYGIKFDTEDFNTQLAINQIDKIISHPNN